MVLGSSSLKGILFLCLVTGILAPMSVWPNVYDIIRASSSYHLHSVSGQQMFERSSASVDRDTGHESSPGGLRSKRTASAHGLNMSTEGRTEHWTLKYDFVKILILRQRQIKWELYVYEIHSVSWFVQHSLKCFRVHNNSSRALFRPTTSAGATCSSNSSVLCS